MAVYAVHEGDPNFIFIINYKVMFTSLNTILRRNFPCIQFYYLNQVKKLNFKKYQKYGIVRNPYHRVISTFKDKCLNAPLNSLNSEKAQLQYCQDQILQALQEVRGINGPLATPAELYSMKEQAEKRTLLNANFHLLRSINFEEYVDCLTLIMKREDVDAHFIQQYKAFYLSSQNPWYDSHRVFNNTKIVKLENIAQAWPSICNELAAPMILQKMNSTKEGKLNLDEEYNAQTKDIISVIYEIDFKKLNYSSVL